MPRIRHAINQPMQGVQQKAAYNTAGLGVLQSNNNLVGTPQIREAHTSGIRVLTTESKIEFPRLARKRNYLLFQNRSLMPLWINFGAPAAQDSGIEIPVGGNYERDTTVPITDIHVLGAYNGQQLNYVFG